MIDLNKKYKTRDGKRETEQLIHRPGNDDETRIIALFTDGTSTGYYENGLFYGDEVYPYDLIPIDEPATPEPKPEPVKTLWDEYAMAAIAGGNVTAKAIIMADWMMKAREERNANTDN